MAVKYTLPPNPQNAVLKRIYPWDDYNITVIIQWLFEYARKTGFYGDFEEFKRRFGAYIEAENPSDIFDILDDYIGPYHIKPLLNVEQILHTKNKILNEDIIIEPIPESTSVNYKKYTGSYTITPRSDINQMLHTANRLLEQNIIVKKISYQLIDNAAGGYTAIIGRGEPDE